MQSTLTDAAAELVALHLSDSALPTGSFSHSYGLESYILQGQVTDAATYSDWLFAYIRESAHSEGLVASLAARIVDKDLPLEDALAELKALDALAHVSLVPRQIRTASQSMGKRMAKIADIVVKDSPLLDGYLDLVKSGECYGSPPLVYGIALRVSGISSELAVTGYLMQLATAINQNAIRGIPLGQDAGQQVLANAHPVILETAQHIGSLGLGDVGACPPGLELAQITHETQLSRMFMS